MTGLSPAKCLDQWAMIDFPLMVQFLQRVFAQLRYTVTIATPPDHKHKTRDSPFYFLFYTHFLLRDVFTLMRGSLPTTVN